MKLIGLFLQLLVMNGVYQGIMMQPFSKKKMAGCIAVELVVSAVVLAAGLRLTPTIIGVISGVTLLVDQEQWQKRVLIWVTLIQLALCWSQLTLLLFYHAKSTWQISIGSNIAEIGVYCVFLAFISILMRKVRSVRIPGKTVMFLLLIPIASGLFTILTGLTSGHGISEEQLNYLNMILVLPLLILLIFLMFLVFFLYSQIAATQENVRQNLLLEKQLSDQKKYYENLRMNQEQIKSIRHDMKNHLDTIQYLLDQGQTREAHELLEQTNHKIQQTRKLIYTGNEAMDTVLNVKLTECEIRHVAVETQIQVPSGIELTFDQAITILGNLLDNAMEASEKIPVPQRKVTLSIRSMNQMLCIRISNRCQQESINPAKISTTKEEKSLHGYGLLNVEQCVHKAGGAIEINCQNHSFETSIILYEKKEKRGLS